MLQQFLVFGFYGALVVMAAYNLLLYFSLRERSYLVFSGFIVISSLNFFLSEMPVFMQYLSESDKLFLGQYVQQYVQNKRITGVIPLLEILLAVVFTKLFFNTRQSLPAVEKWIIVFIKIASGGMVLLMLAPAVGISAVLLLLIIGFLLILASGGIAWRAGIKSARYFVAAWSILATTSIVFVLIFLTSGMPKNMFIRYSPHLGFLCLVLLLAFALADRIQMLVQGVTMAVDTILTNSQNVSAGAVQLSSGVSRQAAATEEVSSSMQQMAANIRQNADNAMQTERIALKAALEAGESGQAVTETVNSMQKIAEKISAVEKIADQTRMLSLNAAIEAAKAQEFGKGFGVVAAEVRALANQSRIIATEIQELIRVGVKRSEKAGEMLNLLVPNIQKTAALVQEINAASQEQDSGVQQVNVAIQQLDQVTQQNAAMAEELASTAEELAAQAAQVQHTIALGSPEHQHPEHVRKPAVTQEESVGAVHALHLDFKKDRRDAQDDDFERY